MQEIEEGPMILVWKTADDIPFKGMQSRIQGKQSGVYGVRMAQLATGQAGKEGRAGFSIQNSLWGRRGGLKGERQTSVIEGERESFAFFAFSSVCFWPSSAV